MTCDYLIVGAGSAGAVLAARLSEDDAVHVLAVEAGPDYLSRDKTPAELLDSRSLPSLDHDWHYTACPVEGRRIPYRRGRVTGGTSAINAAAAQWGRPEDFAAWVRCGNPEWAWDRVHPYFRKLETDVTGSANWHGAHGPITISRYAEHELIPIQRAFRDACLQAGFESIQDHNAAAGSGVGPWPMNREGTTRISSVLGHASHARVRPNFGIRPAATVARVLFEGRRAVGVELVGGEEIAARCVVLSAGAIGSPAILLRSGIGPVAHLDELGIKALVDVPGVGASLWDHAAVPIYLRPRAGECVPGRDPRFQVMAQLTADGSAERDDLQLVMTSHFELSASPALLALAGVPVLAVLRAALMLPRSSGRLRLASTDPNAPPEIDLNYLAASEDRARLRQATRLAHRLACSKQLARHSDGIVAIDDDIVSSDERLDEYMREHVGTYCHALGTARMGPANDDGAVVDSDCRVRDLQNLWVVDASVIPVPLRVVPNLTIMMVAERVADALRHGLLDRA